MEIKKWFVICAWCAEKGQPINDTTWQRIETIDKAFLQDESISHGICPTCSAKFFPDKPEPKAH